MTKSGKAGDTVAEGKIMLVGLGNPGPKYDLTRHNVGFLFADRFAGRFKLSLSRTRFSAVLGTGQANGRQIVCLKPQTYMNLSGQSVSQALQFFDVDVRALIVAHDDIDLPFGALRLKCGGGAGGHKGLQSMDTLLGNQNYFRIRLGIGRPQHESAVTNWVLQRFDDSQLAELGDILERAVDAASMLIVEGLTQTQNRFHGATTNSNH
jgi:PTH1 family peptidyl-tRNA hydrolase